MSNIYFNIYLQNESFSLDTCQAVEPDDEIE